MAREIHLTKGMVAVVDDEDFESLNAHLWCAVGTRTPGLFYAVRVATDPVSGKRTTLQMHREIVRPARGLTVDHVDGNGLNNQRNNLRPATPHQQQGNRRKGRNHTSAFKGVYFSSHHQRWGCSIKVNKRSKNLGLFASEIEAARAYDAAAHSVFGDFAKTNQAMGLL